MAKKKSSGKKSSGKKKSSGGSKNNFVNFDKLIGMAGGAFAIPKLQKIEMFAKQTPTMQALIKIGGGEWLPKQSFVSGVIKNDTMRKAAGDAFIFTGVQELMAINKIAGVGAPRKVRGSDTLAVSIEGLYKAENVSEDVLAEDEFEIGDERGEDLDTVNDDDMSEDELNDDMDGDEDLDTVNDDLDGDDYEL